MSVPDSNLESEFGSETAASKQDWRDYRWQLKVRFGSTLFGFRTIYRDIPVFRPGPKATEQKRLDDRDHYYLDVISTTETMANAGVQFDTHATEPILVIPAFRRVYAVTLATLSTTTLALVSCFLFANQQLIEAGLLGVGGVIMSIILFQTAFYTARIQFTSEGIYGHAGSPSKAKFFNQAWTEVHSTLSVSEDFDRKPGVWLRRRDGQQLQLIQSLSLQADLTIAALIRRKLKTHNK